MSKRTGSTQLHRGIIIAITKNGNQQTTKAHVIMASVFAAFRSRLASRDSFFSRRAWTKFTAGGVDASAVPYLQNSKYLTKLPNMGWQSILCPRLGAESIGWISWRPRAPTRTIAGTMLWTEYRPSQRRPGQP